MREDCKKEIISVCNFLKLQNDVSNVSVDLRDQHVVLSVDKNSEQEDPDWNIVQDIFSEYFLKKYRQPINFDFGEKWTIDVPVTKNLTDGQSKKDISNKIVIYSTNRDDWRLFRYFTAPQAGSGFDDNYFMPSQQIACMEVANLDRIFLYSAKDMALKKFVRNIIELNINCLNESSLQQHYMFAFRQLPKQLRNRFAISLVRIDPNISLYELKNAVQICKMCTDNIFLSFSYTSILPEEKLNAIPSVNGYITTVNSERLNNASDVQKVYDDVTNAFKGKNVFVIFDGKKVSEQVFINRNIKNFYKSEQIDLKN